MEEIYNCGTKQFEKVKLLEMTMKEIKECFFHHPIGVTTYGPPRLVFVIGIGMYVVEK